MEPIIQENKAYLTTIKIVSVVVPALVAVLIFFPSKINIGSWTSILPHFHALLNSVTTLLLILALIAIKRQQINLHKNLMLASLILGALFLLSYVLYHSSADSTIYGDVNADGILSETEKQNVSSSRFVYLGLLLSHILLSIVVVPFVLLAFYYALTNKIDKHRKIVKFTFPIWLYVSVTGVTVYLLISPYYS